ncbi:Diphthamide biosynthesis protein 2 [Bulinus truncatus]|nr:Diphthamide biosynthesis protein 2 [Bulinus truncatus]
MLSTKVFSSDADIQHKAINCASCAVHPDKLVEVYEIEKCSSWANLNNFTNIALQFPDEILIDAPVVAELLKERLKDSTVFILGDTSYGSCCVDEISGQHYGASCIIHYGHACLSLTSKLPVLYVLPKLFIDIDECVSQVKQTCTDLDMKAVIVCDCGYQHAIGKICLLLKQNYRNLICSSLLECHQINSEMSVEDKATATSNVTMIEKCGRRIELPSGDCLSDYSFVFIGKNQSPTLMCMMMTFNLSKFYTYDSHENLFRLEQFHANKALMKRYYLIEKTKDANIVGIVVGTLVVSRYKEMIDHLKNLLKKVGKKSYTFVVGKLNPAKLANFAEVEVFVLVSCPESILFDQSDFYQPIISPLELEMACNQARQWTGDYSLDFNELLPGSAMYIESPDNKHTNSEFVDVSLINNRVRTLGMKDVTSLCEATVKDVDLSNTNMTVSTGVRNAGEFLAARSWKGLEQKLGETPVNKAIEGQHGIAASYDNEPTT